MKLINKITQCDVIMLSYNEVTKQVYNTFTLSLDAKMMFNDLEIVIKSMQEGTSRDKVIAVFDNMQDLQTYAESNELIGFESENNYI